MSKARGSVQEVDLLQIAGIDGRVWQKDGSSTDNMGVVYSLRGEVVRIPGIQPLVEWVDASARDQEGAMMGHHDPTPFYDEFTGTLLPLMSIGAFEINGAVEILVEFGGKVGVVRGNQIYILAHGRRVATRPSEGTQFVQIGGAVLILNGVDENLKWDGHVVSPLGIAQVPSPPTLPAWTDGRGRGEVLFSTDPDDLYPGTGIDKTSADLSNEYSYKLTWVNSEGTESEPSIASRSITDRPIDASSSDRAFWVRIAGLSQPPPQPDITGRRLWRAGSQGQQYYLLADLPGSLSDTYLDGTTVTYSSQLALPAAGTNAPPPRAKFAMLIKGITFYAGNPESPRTLYYSRPNGNKGAVPQPGNTIQVTTEDGSDRIVAMSVASDYGLVFTTRSIHMVTVGKGGSPVVTPINQTIGAVGPRSVTTFEGNIYFFSYTGVFVFDGSSPRPLSSELSSMVEDLPTEFLSDVVAFVDGPKRRVCFSVCAGVKRYKLNGNENNEIWIVHVDTGAISKAPFSVYAAMQYKGEVLVSFGRDSFGVLVDPEASNADNLHMDGNAQFRLTDLGMWGCLNSIAEKERYESFFETRWLIGKNPETDKTFSRIDVFYSQTGAYDLNLEWFVDWEDDLVGSAPVHMHDDTATVWDEEIEESDNPLTLGSTPQLRRWNDRYPDVTAAGGGLTEWFPKNPGKWDEKRVRSLRVDLGSASLPDSKREEGLTAKSIKFRIGLSGPSSTGLSFSLDDMRKRAQWKIIGLVLFYSDHGMRSEGTDVSDD